MTRRALPLKYRHISYTLLVVLTACLAPVLARAQADIHFSQFYETSVLRNPALTGVMPEDYKFGAYYRNQWSSISNPFVTALFSAETRLPVSRNADDYLSFGLLGYTDKAGSIDQKITGIYPAVNYNKSVIPERNAYLSVGFTAGYLQYSFDPDKATFNNQFQNGKFSITNPTMENLPNAKMSLWDLGAGVNFNSSVGESNSFTYIIGISAYHFTQPKFSYYESSSITENMRLNGNAGITASLSPAVSFIGQANYAMQGTYQEIMVGGLINWVRLASGPEPLFGLSGGLFYRYDDAIIPVMKLRYKNMAIGVSYDVNMSTLKEASHMDGGYEITLFIAGNYSDKSGIIRKTICPKF